MASRAQQMDAAFNAGVEFGQEISQARIEDAFDMGLRLGRVCEVLLVTKGLAAGPSQEQITPRTPQEWADLLVSAVSVKALDKGEDALVDAEVVRGALGPWLVKASTMMHEQWSHLP